MNMLLVHSHQQERFDSLCIDLIARKYLYIMI